MVATSSAPFDLALLIAADEYFVVLMDAGRFDRLLRKDDLLDDGVAAVFGLIGTEAHLIGLCFQGGRFTPPQVAAWIAERIFMRWADAPIMRAPPQA